MDGNYVAYYRVSTARQGQSGLGLEAQQEAVQRFLNGGRWKLAGEFKEVETGKGSNALARRPVLSAAIAACKKNKATLLIAKLDRLARNVHFISGLMEAKVPFTAVDMPEANELTINIIAAMAQHESRMISARTKAALAAKKARGEKLGNAHLLKPQNKARVKRAKAFAQSLKNTLQSFGASQMSQREQVAELNKLGVKAPRGGEWQLIQLQRVLARLDG
ncbi:MAG: Resolvase domain [Betaproteobacteria bacterium]|nr:Resolvase domain [Betaproteobacteria bacterium]